MAITRDGFNNTMNALLGIYNKDLPNKSVHEMYYAIFNKNFNSDEELQNATLKVIETRVFPSFPKPAEFLEACNRKEDIDIRIQRAKERLLEGIKKHGMYRNVCFDDPTLHLVIQSFGGWIKLCALSLEELENYFKFDFRREYQAYFKRKDNKIPLFLTGKSSFSNERNGQEDDIKISYVGNKEKCIGWNIAYYNKNKECLINHDKYIQLGFEKSPAIEYKAEIEEKIHLTESKEYKPVEKVVKDISEDEWEARRKELLNKVL